jgi:hypothetical protein
MLRAAAAQARKQTDAAVSAVALQAATHRLSGSSQDTDQELADVLEALLGLSEEHLPLWLREFLVETTWPLEKRSQAFGLPR